MGALRKKRLIKRSTSEAHRVANILIRKWGIRPSDVGGRIVSRNFECKYYVRIRRYLQRKSSSHLLAIVFSGKAQDDTSGVSLCSVHGDHRWLDSRRSGPELFLNLAATALAAAILDVLFMHDMTQQVLEAFGPQLRGVTGRAEGELHG